MADDNAGGTGAQAAPDPQPQAGASQAQAANAQSSQADGADNASGTDDVASLQRQLAASVKAERQLRADRQRLLDAQKAADDAKLPEQERQTRRIAELEQQIAAHQAEKTEWTTQAAVTRAALKLGFLDPADAFALLDRNALDRDEGGAPRNVDKLLADLLKSKPYLGGAGRPTGSADGGVQGDGAATPAMDMNARIRAAAGRA